ncbi:hypothetical protein FBU30_004469 [Linnemannia zychae]|nr:hypothetical protein FBU30_004469 [Linnemannia zychae]
MSKTYGALQVLAIPELLDIIQGSFTSHDLAQCTLVSTEFSTCFTPLLWHTITLTTPEKHLRFTSSPYVQAALLRNSSFVRVIRIFTCKSLRPFLHVKPENLCSLSALEFCWLSTQTCYSTGSTEEASRSAICDITNERVTRSLYRHAHNRQNIFSTDFESRLSGLTDLYKAHIVVEDGPGQTAKDRYHHRSRLLQRQHNEVPLPLLPLWQRPEIVRPNPDTLDYLYEDCKNEQVLIAFLSTFPTLKMFMSTSLVFINPKVFKALGECLDHMRYLSLTLDDIGVKDRHWSLINILNKEYPSLEKMRLIFVNKGWIHQALSIDHQDGSEDLTEDSQVIKDITEPIPSMKSLSIEGDIILSSLARSYTQPWLPFLKRCIHLTTLSLGFNSPAVLLEVTNIISECCPFIDNLALRSFNKSTRIPDVTIGSIFAACSARTEEESKYPASVALSPILKLTSIKRRVGLKQLRFYGHSLQEQAISDPPSFLSTTISPLQALSRHIDSLRHLDFDKPMMDDKGELFLWIVKTFPKLEILNTLPYLKTRANSRHSTGKVDAIKFVESVTTGQWVCTESLRILKVQINGFPSSRNVLTTPATPITTVTTATPADHDNNGIDGGHGNGNSSIEPVSDAFAESLSGLMRTSHRGDLQYRVCQQLNTLTSLEELYLGIQPIDDPELRKSTFGVQSNCLELSLDSGLDQMEDLKQLRVLSVIQMKHKIRLEEVKWMVAAWPKLEAIPGLLSSECYADDERQALRDEEQHILHWIRENRPQLRYSSDPEECSI